MRLGPAILLLLGLTMPEAGAQRREASPTGPALLCREAIQAAEREHRLPGGLLHAIARVESGRPDPAGGAAPWPWTINAEGQGRFFDSKEAAIAAVQALRARGVRLIDVGCLQVNLHHHAPAFPDLETAFDPTANASYAGLFLTRLHAQTRSWEQAAAFYHSQTPELAEAYRLKVMEAWPAMAVRLAEERRRDDLVSAWSNGRVLEARPMPNNGWQVVTMAPTARPAAPRGPGAPLLIMGTPVLRPAIGAPRRGPQPGPTPRAPLRLDLAEAPGRR
ncbi:transglycosylase SLT domain-containing protein [Paracraurococcus ruber]|uniref:Transglycosylase SLT domain-containing protein n=1 Tax=Paracraurococcus ruber TaxID=77675 RepID=A0ABS1CW10_9PROT|nr:transglycosylase SLT domain-containing protein [Paracraurococcus ruber]MBK1658706.1 hypothetical protein [Paracraurococcus ruber]TDG32213.1 hypothetical protein E2C05_08105 [Paracraurococcus ruber]